MIKLHPCAILVTLSLLAACSKVSVENYDKIKNGMTFVEVKQLLGDPTKCDEVIGVRTCEWGDAARQIKVNFAADHVVLSSAKGLK